ncbi:MAG: CRISPR-associated endonuclease Cas1 [Promethearchaeota archaeon]
MILFLEKPGLFIGKSSDLIVVKEKGKILIKVSIREIEAIIIYTNTSISSEAISLLSTYSIPVIYQSGSKIIAYLTPYMNHGFVLTREMQFLTRNTAKAVKLLCSLVKGALINKRQLLLYFAKSKKRTDEKIADALKNSADKISQIINNIDEVYYISKFKNANLSEINRINKKLIQSNLGTNLNSIIEYLYEKPIHKDNLSEIRFELLSKEAQGTKIYFDAIKKLIPPEFGFENRTRRPPRDPISSMLSYGYTILQGFILTGIAVCGLEPFCGFLHTDRSGKASLVYDLIEEFRQPIVDKTVLKMVNKKMISPDDFYREEAFIKIDDKLKGKYLDLLFNEIKDKKRTFDDKNLTYRHGIIYQARKLCRFFIGKEEDYTPYVFTY